MTPPTPHRHRLWALVSSTVLALATGGLAVAVNTAPAQAASVGAGSYTTTPVGPLPSGCGQISSNPRQHVTADAPAGAVPTNDWWSSLLWKRTDCAYSEPLHAHPLSYDTFTDGLGFSANSTPAISGTATGVGEFHYPY
ncbi:hypothetical protein QLR68_28870, partial [Micromonospora sp. DH15]|nr:hypothetical protein [Micromonospora sp. DH15]